VRMELIGRWTWDEAYDGSKVGFTMLESVDHSVNVIIDLRRSTGLPLLSLTHARNMIPRRHPRTGITVFIGANTLFLSLWKIFSNAYGQFASKQEFTFARTIDEAYRIFETQASRAIQTSS
ncbi:MAG: hypothetical protein ABI700_29140, partial [Chloroflexota bacterium]